MVLFPEPEGGYTVEVPALQGCVTYGRTFGEALLMAEDAIQCYLAVLQEDDERLPREGSSVAVQMGRRREAILRKVRVQVGADREAKRS